MKPKLNRYEVTFTLSNYGAGKFWGADKNGTYVRHIRAANAEEAYDKVARRLMGMVMAKLMDRRCRCDLIATMSKLSMKKMPRTK